MAHDYSGHQEEAPPDQLALLNRLVDELVKADNDVDAAEAALATAQERSRKLREGDIPELMLTIGMKDLTTMDGLHVKLREEVRAALPKDAARREQAFDWLKENGHAGLIKHEITVKFTREQYAQAERIFKLLSGENVNVFRKDDIHHQTLCAFLREQLKAGEGVPLPLFGAFIQKFAEVKK